MAPPRSRDVRVNITSQADNKGFKSAEESAKVLERELNRLEQQQRRQVQMHMQASREMAAAEAAKAQAIVDANSRQATAMEASGKMLLGVSAAVAIGLGLSAKAAVGWQSSWAGVTKTIDGSPEQLAAVEAQLRGLARTLPATHEEIAGVAEAAGQLGVARGDIASFTSTMIALGETTNLSADEAATSLAQLSNIMGIGADQASEMGSALVALGNDGASTERDIVEMGLRIAGAGRTVGLTAPQVLGLASALSSVGIEAEAGGTAISRVMLQIGNDVDSGSERIATYARVAGISADEFAAKWRSAPADALNAFIQGLGRVQQEGGNTTQILGELGLSEVRVSDALRRASLAGDLLTESLQTGSEAWDANIALLEEASKRYETTESKLQIARNGLNDAAIDIGGNLLPALTAAADGTANLAAGFGSLPSELQSAVTWLGVGVGAVTGMTGVAATGAVKLKELADGINDLRGGSSGLGRALGGTAAFLTGPWGLALAAATIGVGVWMAKAGEARRRVEELTSSIDDNTGAWSDMSREIVFNALLDSGVIDAAKKAGFELNTVVDAALGSADAYRVLEEQANRTYDAMASSPATYDPTYAQNATNVLEGLRSKSAEAERAQAEYQDRVAAGLTTTQEATGAQQGHNDALAEGTPLTEEATGAIDSATEAMQEWRDTLADASGQFVDVTEAYQAVIDKNTEVAESTAEATESAEDSWSDYYDGVSVSVDDWIAELERQVQAQQSWQQNILTITGQVREQLPRDMWTAADGMIDSLIQKGPEAAAEIEAFMNASPEQKARIVAAWKASGSSSAQEFTYAVESARKPTIELRVDTDHAYSQVAGFIRENDGRVITVNVKGQQIGFKAPHGSGAMSGEANGGIWSGGVKQFADGGIDIAGRRVPRTSQIVPGGRNILWAEQETGWEAYISGKPGMRARNEQILGDVAGRFGMYVGRYANGGITGAAASAPAPPAVLGGVSIGTLTTADPEAAARLIVERQRDAAVLHNLASIATGV